MTPDAERIVRALPCWGGPIAIEPLGGGLSNTAFMVRDGAAVYVARVGEDYPFHHVSRRREAAAQRAAHACGLTPRLVHAGGGALVADFVEGETLGPAGVRARIEPIALLLRRCHVDVARKVRGETSAFWVFQVLRDYLATLEAAGRGLGAAAPRLAGVAEKLEDAQIALPVVFGHHDLLPANFIDGPERLWLIDWEYAGFGTAMFDLANLSANAAFSDAEDRLLLEAYFGRTQPAGAQRAFAAMKVASALREALWALVSEAFLNAPGVDYALYATECMAKFESAYALYRDRF